MLSLIQVQKEFVMCLEDEEDPRYNFRVDRWEREEGGGGVTCVLQVINCVTQQRHVIELIDQSGTATCSRKPA